MDILAVIRRLVHLSFPRPLVCLSPVINIKVEPVVVREDVFEKKLTMR